jgi:hypothetical protein
MPRVAAEGGEGLSRALAVGAQAVVVAAVAAWTDQIANAADSGVGLAGAIAVQMLVTAAGALDFLFFRHRDSSPAVHRQAGRWKWRRLRSKRYRRCG